MMDIRRAELKFEVAIKDIKSIRSKGLLSTYKNKCTWLISDFISQPVWTPELREALRQEFKTDQLISEAIMQKIDYLAPEEREQIENEIDRLVASRKKIAEEIKKTM